MIWIDMPMPKCCDECFALDDHGDYPFCLISQEQRGYTFNVREKRMPGCPLMEREPVEPVFTASIETDLSHWDCGVCGAFILGNAYPSVPTENRPKYCGWCGRKVAWK